MKNRTSKFISAVLSLLMLLCAVFPGISVPASAEEIFTSDDWVYGVYPDDTAIIHRYFGKDETLIIPDQLYGHPVTAIDANAFYMSETLKNVAVPNAVTAIGYGAFSSCAKLENIILPDSLTAIERGVFSSCEALESITLPDSVTTIGENAFFGCTALETITLPAGLTVIDINAFACCTSLKTVSPAAAENEKTAKPDEYIIGGGIFSGCTALESVVLPSGIPIIGDGMFSGCSALKNVTIPESVAAIGDSAFYGCESLEELTIPGDLLSIGNAAFKDCISLKSINNPHPETVIQIGSNAIYGCSTQLSIPIDWMNILPEAPYLITPEPTVSEPAAEPAWEPVRLTQADFEDPLTDLTDEERQAIFHLQYHDFDISHRCEGDIGLTFPNYANLDLDHDGKTDSFFFTEPKRTDQDLDNDGEADSFLITDTGLELRMGNGDVYVLNFDFPLLGVGQSIGLTFCDINNSGTDDILAVSVGHSTIGNLLNITLFTDSNGRYYRQEIPNYKFYLEDLHNDYVRLSCADFPYREVMLIGGLECHPFLEEGQNIFEYYFGDYAVNGKLDESDARIVNVKIDGSRLVVLYDFLTKYKGPITSNPFGVVYRLEPGGYFIIERMGTDVIRDYWLPIETES